MFHDLEHWRRSLSTGVLILLLTFYSWLTMACVMEQYAAGGMGRRHNDSASDEKGAN
jgi:hypothetical protein